MTEDWKHQTLERFTELLMRDLPPWVERNGRWPTVTLQAYFGRALTRRLVIRVDGELLVEDRMDALLEGPFVEAMLSPKQIEAMRQAAQEAENTHGDVGICPDPLED